MVCATLLWYFLMNFNSLRGPRTLTTFVELIECWYHKALRPETGPVEALKGKAGPTTGT